MPLERTGPVKKDSSEAWLTREIMLTGLVLEEIFDDCHTYKSIVITDLERLMRLMLVYNGEIAPEKKGWNESTNEILSSWVRNNDIN